MVYHRKHFERYFDGCIDWLQNTHALQRKMDSEKRLNLLHKIVEANQRSTICIIIRFRNYCSCKIRVQSYPEEVRVRSISLRFEKYIELKSSIPMSRKIVKFCTFSSSCQKPSVRVHMIFPQVLHYAQRDHKKTSFMYLVFL